MMHLSAIAMSVQSNITAILLAMAATVVTGFLWYGPIFGKQWMKLNNLKQPKKEDMKFSMMLPGICASLFTAFIQAAVIARTFEVLAVLNLGQALIIGIIFWLPFTALVWMSSNTWLGRSQKNTLIDAGHQLVSVMAICAVLYGMM